MYSNTRWFALNAGWKSMLIEACPCEWLLGDLLESLQNQVFAYIVVFSLPALGQLESICKSASAIRCSSIQRT